MSITRRGFLIKSAVGLLAAPAIVRAGGLMPVRAWVEEPVPDAVLSVEAYGDDGIATVVNSDGKLTRHKVSLDENGVVTIHDLKPGKVVEIRLPPLSWDHQDAGRVVNYSSVGGLLVIPL